MDRILGRVTLGTASPRDLGALAASLRAVATVPDLLAELLAPLTRSTVKDLDPPLLEPLPVPETEKKPETAS